MYLRAQQWKKAILATILLLLAYRWLLDDRAAVTRSQELEHFRSLGSWLSLEARPWRSYTWATKGGPDPSHHGFGTPTTILQPTAADTSTPRPSVSSKVNDNILLAIKTGATEALEKLPVHFETTFKSWPNILVFSDYAETIAGHPVYDALGNISDTVRLEHRDFALWRRLNSKGRAALGPQEISTGHAREPDSRYGKLQNEGWRLARFMNLPMIVKAVEMRPDVGWYVFVDADTYISYANVVQWTAQLDHTSPKYLGAEAAYSGQLFGHGGSDYIISSAAASQLAEYYTANRDHWDWIVSRNWAGDYALALALNQTGVSLTRTYPFLQGGTPTSMDFAKGVRTKSVERLWCYPAVSYHHVSPETLRHLWDFEQQWLRSTTAERPTETFS